MIEPTRASVMALLQDRGWPIQYPAIVALRDTSIGADVWGEWLCALTADGFMACIGTTDPGAAPMAGTGHIRVNPHGVARIPEGFVLDLFYPGFHGSGGRNADHPCWRQCDGQFGTKSKPILVERWQHEKWVPITHPAVGPFNFHRAMMRGTSQRVGDFSHGCLVVRLLIDHWRMCLLLGYPEHGPTPEQMATMRCSLYLFDITPE